MPELFHKIEIGDLGRSQGLAPHLRQPQIAVQVIAPCPIHPKLQAVDARGRNGEASRGAGLNAVDVNQGVGRPCPHHCHHRIKPRLDRSRRSGYHVVRAVGFGAELDLIKTADTQVPAVCLIIAVIHQGPVPCLRAHPQIDRKQIGGEIKENGIARVNVGGEPVEVKRCCRDGRHIGYPLQSGLHEHSACRAAVGRAVRQKRGRMGLRGLRHLVIEQVRHVDVGVEFRPQVIASNLRRRQGAVVDADIMQGAVERVGSPEAVVLHVPNLQVRRPAPVLDRRSVYLLGIQHAVDVKISPP